MKKKLLATLLLLAGLTTLSSSFASCSKLKQRLDGVEKSSVRSFDAVLRILPDKVREDETGSGWSLSSPDDTARFIWSGDLILETDARPFLDAGLDPEKLPDTHVLEGDRIRVGVKLGDDETSEPKDAEASPLAAYERMVNSHRDDVSYQKEADHYAIRIGNGNAFEWAKDLETNEMDVVFVLNPEPFVAAGVEPDAVAGWFFTKRTTNREGKPAEVDRFIKPYRLD